MIQVSEAQAEKMRRTIKHSERVVLAAIRYRDAFRAFGGEHDPRKDYGDLARRRDAARGVLFSTLDEWERESAEG